MKNKIKNIKNNKKLLPYSREYLLKGINCCKELIKQEDEMEEISRTIYFLREEIINQNLRQKETKIDIEKEICNKYHSGQYNDVFTDIVYELELLAGKLIIKNNIYKGDILPSLCKVKRSFNYLHKNIYFISKEIPSYLLSDERYEVFCKVYDKGEYYKIYNNFTNNIINTCQKIRKLYFKCKKRNAFQLENNAMYYASRETIILHLIYEQILLLSEKVLQITSFEELDHCKGFMEHFIVDILHQIYLITGKYYFGIYTAADFDDVLTQILNIIRKFENIEVRKDVLIKDYLFVEEDESYSVLDNEILCEYSKLKRLIQSNRLDFETEKDISEFNAALFEQEKIRNILKQNSSK